MISLEHRDRELTSKIKYLLLTKLQQGGAAAISDGVDVPVLDHFGKYWGMQVVHCRHSKALYSNQMEKFNKRMESWKTKCFSRANQVMLASSVISNLSNYQMQTAMLLESIFKGIGKCTRKCVWGSNKARRRVHFINWSTLCKTKEGEPWTTAR